VQRSSRNHRLPGGVLIGALAFVCFACAIGDNNATNFREDVVLCEEAVAHLQDCCPQLGDVYPEACQYRDDGCNDGREVALNLPASRCIRQKECAALVTEGVCDRAKDLVSATAAIDAGAAQVAEVCKQ
jgi:hypothetical protein